VSYLSNNLSIGAASPGETGTSAEGGVSRLGGREELELARAVISGDGETASKICVTEYLRYLAEEEERTDGGPVHDLSSTFIDPVSSISRSFH
jgi:hypothetical protein